MAQPWTEVRCWGILCSPQLPKGMKPVRNEHFGGFYLMQPTPPFTEAVFVLKGET